VRVSAECTVRLWDAIDFQGSTRTYGPGVHNLDNWHYVVSSAACNCGQTQTTLANPQVPVFGTPGFMGLW
jgi:hypothetical protein